MWQGIYSDFTKTSYIHLCNPIPRHRFTIMVTVYVLSCTVSLWLLPVSSETDSMGVSYNPNGVLSGGCNGFIGLIYSDTPHLWKFWESTLWYKLSVSNSLSFTLVWFTLTMWKLLIFWVWLSTMFFVHEAAVPINCCGITFLLLLVTECLGSLWSSRIKP